LTPLDFLLFFNRIIVVEDVYCELPLYSPQKVLAFDFFGLDPSIRLIGLDLDVDVVAKIEVLIEADLGFLLMVLWHCSASR